MLQEHSLLPSPIPGNVTPKEAKKYKSLAVLKAFTTPSTFEQIRVPDALQQVFPDLFATVSAAKKATRSESNHYSM